MAATLGWRADPRTSRSEVRHRRQFALVGGAPNAAAALGCRRGAPAPVNNVVTTDFLIIGSGIAGLRAALALAPAGRVLVLTKANPTESNTGYAQGGIAAAMGADDSGELHAADTIRAMRCK